MRIQRSWFYNEAHLRSFISPCLFLQSRRINNACIGSVERECFCSSCDYAFLRDSTRIYLKAGSYLSNRRSLRCEKNILLLLQHLAHITQNNMIYHSNHLLVLSCYLSDFILRSYYLFLFFLFYFLSSLICLSLSFFHSNWLISFLCLFLFFFF